LSYQLCFAREKKQLEKQARKIIAAIYFILNLRACQSENFDEIMNLSQLRLNISALPSCRQPALGAAF
jgi:hypothetical protein